MREKKSFEFGALRAHIYLFDIDKYEEDILFDIEHEEDYKNDKDEDDRGRG